MPAKNPITPGTRFGRWTALEAVKTELYQSGTKIRFQECRCDCGTVRFVGSYKLRTGHSRSCGCLQSEVTTARSFKHGHSKRGARSRTYRAWRNMISRCTNPNVQHYADYGARGICVCQRWLSSFYSFLQDMGESPEGLTIDRENNDGNYEPGNCKWRTAKQQARNTRRNMRVSFNGQTFTVSEWSERTGFLRSTIEMRLHRGWSVASALTVPVREKESALFDRFINPMR